MYMQLATLGSVVVLFSAVAAHSRSTSEAPVTKAAPVTKEAPANVTAATTLVPPDGFYTRDVSLGDWYDEADTAGLEEIKMFLGSWHYDTLPTSPNWGPWDNDDVTAIESNLDTYVPTSFDWFLSDFEEILTGGWTLLQGEDEPEREELDNMVDYTDDYSAAIGDWVADQTGTGDLQFGLYNFPTAGKRLASHYEGTPWITRQDLIDVVIDTNCDFVVLRVYPGGPDDFASAILEEDWIDAYIDAAVDNWDLGKPIICFVLPMYKDSGDGHTHLLTEAYVDTIIDIIWDHRADDVRICVYALYGVAEESEAAHDTAFADMVDYIDSLTW